MIVIISIIYFYFFLACSFWTAPFFIFWKTEQFLCFVCNGFQVHYNTPKSLQKGRITSIHFRIQVVLHGSLCVHSPLVLHWWWYNNKNNNNRVFYTKRRLHYKKNNNRVSTKNNNNRAIVCKITALLFFLINNSFVIWSSTFISYAIQCCHLANSAYYSIGLTF